MPARSPRTRPAPLTGVMAVIAKTPEPGRVKTRLCPPLTTEHACAIAWACLLDTLATASTVRARRHVLLLDGEPGPWIPGCFDVVPQRGNGLGERLSAGFTDIGDDAIVIAMDTPHVDPALLARALAALARGTDSVIGSADDGGYWIIGLRHKVESGPVFAGIPMSTPETGRHQLARLRALGLSVLTLPVLRDLDTVADLAAIAALAPGSRLAAAVNV